MAIYMPQGTGNHNHTYVGVDGQHAVWGQWTNVGYTTTTNAITYNPTHNHGMWQDWIQTTTTASTTAYLTYDPVHTWEQWDEIPHVYYQHRVAAVTQPTQEQLDAAQRRREEDSARRLAAQTKLQGAQDRALELLHSLLTEDQLDSLIRDEEIQVRGSDGGLYVIETGNGRVHGNIRQVDEHGCMLGRLCVQPGMYDQEERASLPSADGHVGQLLAIRFNEAALRERANWSSRQACRQPDVPILRAA